MAKQKTKKFGLIGKTLNHSISKSVHNKLHNNKYQLIELAPEQLNKFFDDSDFDAINVTIPYKSAVIPFLHHIDELAKKIGAVNTIVNNNSILSGYNTDYYGLKFLLEHHNVSLKDKYVLILGNGGSSKTVFTLCQEAMTKDIKIASRTPCPNTCSFDQALSLNKTQVIINTTPVGMFPHIHAKPISLANFKSLTLVIDLIYNPLCTELLYEAKQMNIKCIGGLLMLVAQAKFASDIFLNIKTDNSKILDIYDDIISKQQNIVLIGMPGCGKSHIGFLISKKLNIKHIDTDKIIEQSENLSVKQIFDKFGEEYFRKREQEVIKNISINTNVVISTGGGSVLHEDSMKDLSKNGVIIFIDRNTQNLSTKNRPLSFDINAIKEIYNSRINLYRKYSDIVVKNNHDIKSCTKEILIAIKKKGLSYNNE